MNASIEPSSRVRHTAEWLFALIALGEIGIGLLGTLFPAAVIGFLLGAPIEGTGAVAARLAGIAVASVGISWWPDRNRLDAERLRQIAAGFIVYNLGVGLLFVAYAWTADRLLPVAWLVAAVHLFAGGAFVVIMNRASPTAAH